MIPNFNMQEFLSAAKKEAERLEKNDKQKKTSCSQQSLANSMVGQSLPAGQPGPATGSPAQPVNS